MVKWDEHIYSNSIRFTHIMFAPYIRDEKPPIFTSLEVQISIEKTLMNLKWVSSKYQTGVFRQKLTNILIIVHNMTVGSRIFALNNYTDKIFLYL